MPVCIYDDGHNGGNASAWEWMDGESFMPRHETTWEQALSVLGPCQCLHCRAHGGTGWGAWAIWLVPLLRICVCGHELWNWADTHTHTHTHCIHTHVYAQHLCFLFHAVDESVSHSMNCTCVCSCLVWHCPISFVHEWHHSSMAMQDCSNQLDSPFWSYKFQQCQLLAMTWLLPLLLQER